MSFNVKCYIIKPNNIKRWLVLGKTKEYLVTEKSCTCRDFLLKITKKEQGICKHIVLLNESIKNSEFDTYEITTQEFRKIRYFLLELKK